MSADSELQRAMVAALAADQQLSGLIGMDRVFDRLIEGTKPPYVVFDEHAVEDWSTASEPGEEHRVTLRVFSDLNGKREAQAIMGRVRELLHDRPLVLQGIRLVNLRLERAAIAREEKSKRHRGTMVFRAVTEEI